MTSRIACLLLGLVCGAVAGLSYGYTRWRNPDLVDYPATRENYLANVIRQSGPIDTLVLGDSIVESTWLDGVCGTTLNAGVGRSRAETAQRLAAIALPRLNPKTVIVNVGRNYFSSGKSLAQMEAGYTALLDRLAGRKLILVGVPLSAPATEFIRQEAAKRGAAFVPPVPRQLTFEGVHPTPQGGALLRARIAAACR